MADKHTPGPWVVDGNDISPADNDRLGICSVQPVDDVRGGWRFGKETEANARLIAAAPELLAMVVKLRTEFSDLLEIAVRRGWGDDANTRSMIKDALADVDSVILKARGDQ